MFATDVKESYKAIKQEIKEEFDCQPHEGTIYASQKVLQMVSRRLENVRSRLNELKKNKVRIQSRNTQRQMPGQHQDMNNQQV